MTTTVFRDTGDARGAPTRRFDLAMALMRAVVFAGIAPTRHLRAFFRLSFLFAGAGMMYDRVTRGRVYRVYLWGGANLLLSVPLRLISSGTSAWRGFVEWLVG